MVPLLRESSTISYLNLTESSLDPFPANLKKRHARSSGLNPAYPCSGPVSSPVLYDVKMPGYATTVTTCCSRFEIFDMVASNSNIYSLPRALVEHSGNRIYQEGGPAFYAPLGKYRCGPVAAR